MTLCLRRLFAAVRHLVFLYLLFLAVFFITECDRYLSLHIGAVFQALHRQCDRRASLIICQHLLKFITCPDCFSIEFSNDITFALNRNLPLLRPLQSYKHRFLPACRKPSPFCCRYSAAGFRGNPVPLHPRQSSWSSSSGRQ